MAMSEKHRNLLREKRIQLLKDMKLAEPFLSYFQRDRTLTDEMIAEIKEPLVYTNRERVAKLLDRLPSRGANAFKILIEALIETEQEALAKFLDPDVTIPSDETDSAKLAAGDGDGPRETSTEFIVNLIEQRSALEVRRTENTKFNKQRGAYKTSQPANCKALILSVSNGGTDNGLNEDRKMVEALCKGLGFKVDSLTVNAEELIDKLKKEPSNLSASHDAFVLFILRCPANLKVNLKDIFDGTNCEGLLGKPKLMFLQICDASAGQITHVVPDCSQAQGVNSGDASTGQKHVVPGPSQADGAGSTKSPHPLSAILIVKIYDKLAVNQRSFGVTGLCYTFAEYARYNSIADLLISANGVVSKWKNKKGLDGSGDIVTTFKTLETYFFNLPKVERPNKA